MAPAQPTGGALFGALLLACAASEAGALQPVGGGTGDEAPALEKEEWPRRKARREAGHLIDTALGNAWHTDESLHGFGRASETDDDLDLHDGLPPAAGCYMRMSSGCPRQPMRTQAWRRDKMATERGLDEEGCRQRKQVWERYCGSEDAEMLYVSGQASSGPVSALQVDAARWPQEKEGTKRESPNDPEHLDERLDELTMQGSAGGGNCFDACGPYPDCTSEECIGCPECMSGQASSGRVSALQVGVARWPQGKEQEGTERESPKGPTHLDERLDELTML